MTADAGARPAIRVFLLDDHEVVRRGVQEMLEADASVREALEVEMARRLERMDSAAGS